MPLLTNPWLAPYVVFTLISAIVAMAGAFVHAKAMVTQLDRDMKKLDVQIVEVEKELRASLVSKQDTT